MTDDTTTTEKSPRNPGGRPPIGARLVTHLPPHLMDRVNALAQKNAEGTPQRPNAARAARELIILGLSVNVSPALRERILAEQGF